MHFFQDRGFAMIPLPAWGRTLDWRMYKKFSFLCIHLCWLRATGAKQFLGRLFGAIPF